MSVKRVFFMFWVSFEAQASSSLILTAWNTTILPAGPLCSITEIKKWWSFSNLQKKILIVTILSGLYFSCNILYLSHPSSHVHNNFLFYTSHVHQNKFLSCPVTAQRCLRVSRTEKLGVPTVQSNGSGYTEDALWRYFV